MTDSLDLETLRVYRFVRDYIAQHGMAPSQREIARGSFMAPSTMIIYLTRLEMLGWLHREYNIPRSIRTGDYAPTDQEVEALWQELLEADDSSSPS